MEQKENKLPVTMIDNLKCADCGADTTGVARVVGRLKKERKIVCLKCARDNYGK